MKWARSSQIGLYYRQVYWEAALGRVHWLQGLKSGESPWGKWCRGKGERKRERAHNQREKKRRREWETQTFGLYREGQPGSWTGKFKVRDRVCQVGTEGCWENLEARSALACKYASQALVFRVWNQTLRWGQQEQRVWGKPELTKGWIRERLHLCGLNWEAVKAYRIPFNFKWIAGNCKVQ